MNSHFVSPCHTGLSAFRICWWIGIVSDASGLGLLKKYEVCKAQHSSLLPWNHCSMYCIWMYKHPQSWSMSFFFENKKLLHIRDMMEDVYSLYNLPAVNWDQWHFPEKINYPKFAAHSYSISSQQMLISMLLLIGIHFRFCLKWR